MTAMRRWWRAYCDHQVRRAIAVMLHALDDRALADIGVNRAEAEALIVAKPRVVAQKSAARRA